MSAAAHPGHWARSLAIAVVLVAFVVIVSVPLARSGAPGPGQATPEPIDWHACEPEGFQCASVPVPLDPDDPDGARTALFLKRLPASGSPGERIGTLFLNPGGPGGSANDFLVQVAPMMAEEVRDAFDLVALNPRGVAPSSPTISCPGPGDDDRWANTLPTTTADWSEFFAWAAPITAQRSTSCQLAFARTGAFYGTNVVVEDLEWLRRAVGDDAVNYWGVSYGTRIGEVYAQRYPDRIRSMVLDGNIDPAVTQVTFTSERAASFDDAFAFFVDQFPDAGPAFETVATALGSGPMQVLDANSGEPVTLTYSSLVGEVIMGVLSAEVLWTLLAGELVALADQVEGGPTASVLLAGQDENASTVNTQVNCTDLTDSPSVETMISTATTMSAEGPTFGSAVAMGVVACFGFPLPVDAVPDASPPATLPPVLLLGSVHDPSTPYVWSEAMEVFLPNSVLVTYEGAQHGTWNTTGACIADLANAYVLELSVPAPGIECPFVMP